MEELNSIVKWFSSQCDSDWEHENYLKIYSTDNPGWGVDIDIKDTHLEGVVIDYKIDNGHFDWIQIHSDGNKFTGYGGVQSLQKILSFFVTKFIPIANKNYNYEIFCKVSNSDIPIWRKVEAELISDGKHIIKSIPKIDFLDLKFENFDDAEKINHNSIDFGIDYNIGDTVECELMVFADGIFNIIR